MSHIFISYNHEDNNFSEVLGHKLHDSGFSTWRDVDMLYAGEVWRVEIDQAIKDSFAMIVIMTPEAKISEYVTYEWAFALGVGMKIIPIMLKSTDLHPRLEDIQYLDFTSKDQPWTELIDTVQKVAKSNKSNKKPIPIYIQQAITGLNSLKATEREEAIQSLAESDHPAAREALIEGLEHPRKEMRIQIGLLLAEYKEPKAIPILIDALYSKDDDILKQVITALAELGLPAIPDLRRVLNDDDKKVRKAAIETSGKIGNITVVSDLIKALHDSDEEVKICAAKALGEIKDVAASASFLEAIKDLLEVIKNKNNDIRFRSTAITVLASIGDANTVPDLSECLLHDDDANIRFRAAHALGNIRSITALPALIASMDDPDDLVRLYVVIALGQIRDIAAIPALTNALNDSDTVVVDRSLGALRHIGTPEALSAIENWRKLQKNN